jgi:hypothetical protein
MKMLRLLPVALLALAGCSTTYYEAMEKIGVPKREILVNRVDSTRQAETKAKKQFSGALEKFLAVTKVDGGDLQKKYEELNGELEDSEARAREVRDQIAGVEDVAQALFTEWKKELREYANPDLRRQSQHEYDATRRRYDTVIRLMHRSAARMDPVLVAFRDQVLFLKHNLNARALTSLDLTGHTLDNEVARLIADMDASIREAESFVRDLAPVKDLAPAPAAATPANGP